LSYIYLDPDKLEEIELVWDYKNGYIIDADSGEVVGEIMVADPTMSFENELEDELKFNHYKVLRQYVDLTPNQRRTWGKAWLYIKSRGYNVDPYILAKIVKQIYESKRKASPKTKTASATILALRISGYSINIEQICRELELDEKECNQVYDVLREMRKDGVPIPTENRYAKILNLVNQFPDKEVTTVAQKLLKYAKIDGKPSTSVASTLIYVASLLLGKDITMKRVAEFYNVSEVSIRNNYKGKVLPISVTQTRAGVVTEIRIPSSICRELEDFRLSPKVICIS
jgi:transcription initiation factor TFIIIB Brf1 subunit/transcription initiation factor TFIIB